MTQRVGVLLLPGFHLLEWAGFSEVLAACNTLGDGAPFEEALLSIDGRPVPAANGRLQPVDAALATLAHGQALVVVAARLPEATDLAACMALVDAGKRAAWLGGIGSGAGWLAAAGLINGQRCTVRIDHVTELAARHPEVLVSARLYEADGPVLSCAGGSASLDMAIAWAGRQQGQRIGRELLMHFGLDRLRAADEQQTQARSAAAASPSGRLTEALALMEANLAEPLATEDIAQLVGVSRRQLERLFKQHLDDLPARWYMNLRLAKARRQLREGSQSILQIGLSCGFASGPHFSRAYRARFGLTPRDERAQRAQAWRAAPAADTSEDFAAPGAQGDTP